MESIYRKYDGISTSALLLFRRSLSLTVQNPDLIARANTAAPQVLEILGTSA
jgi:hypothetical protein